MRNEVVIQNTFAGTTVNIQQVRLYLFNPCLGHYVAAINRGESEEVLKVTLQSETVELAIRWSLSGSIPLSSIFFHVRDFYRTNPVVASGMINLVIIRLRRDFTERQWYELLIKLDAINYRIERFLKRLSAG